MPIKVTCSNCGGVLHAPDDAGGKKGRCPTCGNVLPIPAEAPRVAASPTVPDSPPKTTARSQSFGEFAHAGSANDHNAPVRASSHSAADARRASVPLPPPNATKNRAGFTAKSDANEGGVRGWKRVGRGLWWVRAGVFFLMLAVLIPNGLKLYEHFAKPLPVKNPGYAGVAWLNSTQEIEVASIGVPLVLGLPLLLLGRLGVSGAPARSRTSGLPTFAAIATLVAVIGGVMFMMPAVAMIATEDAGIAPPFIVKLQNQPAQWQMFATTDTEGLMQRGGILLGFFGLALAELWFLSGLGRIGTALDSPRLAGRTTRMTLLYGLFLAAAFLLAVGSFKPSSMVGDAPNSFADFGFQVSKYFEDQWRLYGQPQYDKLAEHKTAVRPALGVLAGLIVGFGYFRMVGAGRTAVRNWLDTNDRP